MLIIYGPHPTLRRRVSVDVSGDVAGMKIKWQNLSLVPSNSAMRELFEEAMTLEDVRYVLENGYSCERSRRARNTHEMCLDRGRRTTKVVVKRIPGHIENQDVWLITHVGTYSRRG